MKKAVALAAISTVGFLTVGIRHANASTFVLTFEGLKDQELVQSYYNGGLGGSGSGPGPSDGVTFAAQAEAIISNANGGSGNFSNPPSGDTVLFFPTGSATMDDASGFNTGFSFYYALQNGSSATVSIYSGLDGTGTLLGSEALTSTPTPYTVWVPTGLAFSGTAESALFTGSANFVGFDNVTFGSSVALPEPVSLSSIGIAGISLLSRRRRRVSWALPANAVA